MIRTLGKKTNAVSEGVISRTAIATTSGTSHNFTIPSWAVKITGSVDGLSMGGGSDVIIRLGDDGGIETSGYLMSWFEIDAASTTTGNNTAGFTIIDTPNAAATYYGHFTLTRVAAGTWVFSSSINGDNKCYVCSGSKALSNRIENLSITTTGGVGTFDAGSFHIMYE